MMGDFGATLLENDGNAHFQNLVFNFKVKKITKEYQN